MLSFVSAVCNRAGLTSCLLAAASLLCGPARAVTIAHPAPCITYQYTSAQLPNEIADLFRAMKQELPPDANEWIERSAVERCDFGKAAVMGSFSYAWLTPPIAARGVCLYTRWDITPMFSEDRKFLGKDVPDKNGQWPVQRMALGGPVCPLQDDQTYVYVEKTPPGAFHSLMTFWRGVMSNEEDLDAALSQLAPEVRNREEYGHFRRFARDRDAFRRDPWSIRLGSIIPSYKDDVLMAPLYEIDAGGFMIDVDLTDQGWRIQRIRRPIP